MENKFSYPTSTQINFKLLPQFLLRPKFEIYYIESENNEVTSCVLFKCHKVNKHYMEQVVDMGYTDWRIS